MFPATHLKTNFLKTQLRPVVFNHVFGHSTVQSKLLNVAAAKLTWSELRELVDDLNTVQFYEHRDTIGYAVKAAATSADLKILNEWKPDDIGERGLPTSLEQVRTGNKFFASPGFEDVRN